MGQNTRNKLVMRLGVYNEMILIRGLVILFTVFYSYTQWVKKIFFEENNYLWNLGWNYY